LKVESTSVDKELVVKGYSRKQDCDHHSMDMAQRGRLNGQILDLELITIIRNVFIVMENAISHTVMRK
jgi:hypothetical protein